MLPRPPRSGKVVQVPKVMPQKRTQQRTVEQVQHVPVPMVQEEMAQVPKGATQRRMQQRIITAWRAVIVEMGATSAFRAKERAAVTLWRAAIGSKALRGWQGYVWRRRTARNRAAARRIAAMAHCHNGE